MKKILFLFFQIFTLINISLEGTKSKVEGLFDEYDGEIYSGYIDTLIEGNKLFYVFFPSQNNPSKDPVLLWLNGGPGCSSLFGMLGEIGPVTTDNFSGKFKKNDFSWNMNTNLLFIEQPAGVGFSITSDPKYNWTDIENAKNLMAGIKDFFEVFSELKGREFYISGESYAGIFIPHLATEILKDSSLDKINLKGIMIGNALTYIKTDYDSSLVEFGFWHGLISLETYKAFQRNCPHHKDELQPEEENYIFNNENLREVTHKCNEARKEISKNFCGSDVYGIYRICPFINEVSKDNPLYLNYKYSIKQTLLRNIKTNFNKEKENNFGLEPEEEVWPYYTCNEDLTVDNFLNLDSTKKILNVSNYSTIWTQCADINYEWSDSIHLYNSTLFNQSEIKTWLFSGTEDGVISTIGTLRWINLLNYKVEKKWSQWKVNQQVAGYAQKYEEGLVIVTVKGAGHMVPQDKRAEAKFILDSFLKGVLPSDNQ